MTPAQARVLQSIRDLTIDEVSPTITDIAADTGMARSNVHGCICALTEQGRIIRQPLRSRSIVVVEDQVSPAVLERLSDEALRRTIAVASGLLAQRASGGAAQQVLDRIADRLPGAPRRSA
jgi:DNA-binding MarR family transcriptional regulator